MIEPSSANGLGNGWGDAENTLDSNEPLSGAGQTDPGRLELRLV